MSRQEEQEEPNKKKKEQEEPKKKKMSKLGVRISKGRKGARLISRSHIKFSGFMSASMLGGKAGKGRGRSWRWRRSWASDCMTPASPSTACAGGVTRPRTTPGSRRR